MATRDFSKFFLYRWRYVLGYALVGLLLAGLLLFAGLYLPSGLSEAEMSSVVNSAALSLSSPESLAITNLPYHAFQAAILSVFGISIFTIKLPSLILGLLSALGIILLLRRWFKHNIAVLASLIAVSTGQFLYIAQSGNPSVLYIFWPITLLLLGTQITRSDKFRLLWKVLFAITAALSLYTPLSIYSLVAIGLAVAFHPHLRSIIRRLSRKRLTIVSAMFVVLFAPLAWLGTVNSGLWPALMGVPGVWPPDIAGNIATLLKQYFLFWSPSSTTVMTPVFGLGSSLLIALGFYRLIKTRETTRSYLIVFWIICLVPVLVLNPSFTTVTFLPSVLMLAAGLTTLISYWYRLFPFNPYARVLGLIPIVILVGTLIITGVARYVFGYHYSPSVAPLFSKDLRLLPEDTTQLVVSAAEQPFFEAVAKFNQNLEVVENPSAESFVVTRQARQDFSGYTVKQIITSERSSQADRLYVMQRKS